ncbi:protein-disulfide isomerase [Xenococcus sp. PCC 7305]|uniref:DsbA family protein n=1 Tax=Xenococcus sp. PCC 7305 TaxID=102125 RepID=UPI0002AD0DC5|nr:DsbA family protein [Xenococcus sp. PCC 7305]ELS02624.1 protein-disulfide isomerase [Xenococcus sp. PCC 7305]
MSQLCFIPLILSLFLGSITLSGFSSSTPISASLEDQVLQIIRNHPEVLIESVQSYQQRKQQERLQAQQTFLQQIKAAPVSVIGNSPTIGAAANKIVLLEFSDFQCPFCAQAEPTVGQFIAKHQDQVTLVYKHFPLSQIHPQAESSAHAAWAAQQQDKFWEYHNALFAQQNQLGEALYLTIAENLNLDIDQFNRDRNSPEAKAAINQDLELAQRVGIRATPFFALNGEILSLPLKISAMEDILLSNQ